MIAADQPIRLDCTDFFDDGIGISAVANQIAEDERAVVGEILGGGEDSLERLHVGVNVAEDQIAHTNQRDWP